MARCLDFIVKIINKKKIYILLLLITISSSSTQVNYEQLRMDKAIVEPLKETMIFHLMYFVPIYDI